MNARAPDKESKSSVLEFFQDILDKKDAPVHYENLRGFISTAPENIKQYIKKACKGPDLLDYFRKRKNYFTVDRFENVSLEGKKFKKAPLCDEETTDVKRPDSREKIGQPMPKVVKKTYVRVHYPKPNVLAWSSKKCLKCNKSALSTASNIPSEDICQCHCENTNFISAKMGRSFNCEFPALPERRHTELGSPSKSIKMELCQSNKSNKMELDRPSKSIKVELDQPSKSVKTELDQPSKSVKTELDQPSKNIKVEPNRPSKNVKVDMDQPSKSNKIERDQSNKSIKVELGQPSKSIKDELSSEEKCVNYFRKLIQAKQKMSHHEILKRKFPETVATYLKSNKGLHAFFMNHSKIFCMSNDGYLTLFDPSESKNILKGKEIGTEEQDAVATVPESATGSLDDTSCTSLNISPISLPDLSVVCSGNSQETRAVCYVVEIIQKNPSVVLKNLISLISAAPQDVHSFINQRFKGKKLKKLLQSYPSIFVIKRSEEVSLCRGYELRLASLNDTFLKALPEDIPNSRKSENPQEVLKNVSLVTNKFEDNSGLILPHEVSGVTPFANDIKDTNIKQCDSSPDIAKHTEAPNIPLAAKQIETPNIPLVKEVELTLNHSTLLNGHLKFLVVWTTELFCIQVYIKNKMLEHDVENDCVVYFINVLSKCFQNIMCYDNLGGKLHQAPPKVSAYINQYFHANNLKSFFEKHGEFFAQDDYVSLSKSHFSRDLHKQNALKTIINNILSSRPIYFTDEFCDLYFMNYSILAKLVSFIQKKRQLYFSKVVGFLSQFSNEERIFLKYFDGGSAPENLKNYMEYFKCIFFIEKNLVSVNDKSCELLKEILNNLMDGKLSTLFNQGIDTIEKVVQAFSPEFHKKVEHFVEMKFPEFVMSYISDIENSFELKGGTVCTKVPSRKTISKDTICVIYQAVEKKLLEKQQIWYSELPSVIADSDPTLICYLKDERPVVLLQVLLHNDMFCCENGYICLSSNKQELPILSKRSKQVNGTESDGHLHSIFYELLSEDMFKIGSKQKYDKSGGSHSTVENPNVDQLSHLKSSGPEKPSKSVDQLGIPSNTSLNRMSSDLFLKSKSRTNDSGYISKIEGTNGQFKPLGLQPSEIVNPEDVGSHVILNEFPCSSNAKYSKSKNDKVYDNNSTVKQEGIINDLPHTKSNKLENPFKPKAQAVLSSDIMLDFKSFEDSVNTNNPKSTHKTNDSGFTSKLTNSDIQSEQPCLIPSKEIHPKEDIRCSNGILDEGLIKKSKSKPDGNATVECTNDVSKQLLQTDDTILDRQSCGDIWNVKEPIVKQAGVIDSTLKAQNIKRCNSKQVSLKSNVISNLEKHGVHSTNVSWAIPRPDGTTDDESTVEGLKISKKVEKPLFVKQNEALNSDESVMNSEPYGQKNHQTPSTGMGNCPSQVLAFQSDTDLVSKKSLLLSPSVDNHGISNISPCLVAFQDKLFDHCTSPNSVISSASNIPCLSVSRQHAFDIFVKSSWLNIEPVMITNAFLRFACDDIYQWNFIPREECDKVFKQTKILLSSYRIKFGKTVVFHDFFCFMYRKYRYMDSSVFFHTSTSINAIFLGFFHYLQSVLLFVRICKERKPAIKEGESPDYNHLVCPKIKKEKSMPKDNIVITLTEDSANGNLDCIMNNQFHGSSDMNGKYFIQTNDIFKVERNTKEQLVPHCEEMQLSRDNPYNYHYGQNKGDIKICYSSKENFTSLAGCVSLLTKDSGLICVTCLGQRRSVFFKKCDVRCNLHNSEECFRKLRIGHKVLCDIHSFESTANVLLAAVVTLHGYQNEMGAISGSTVKPMFDKKSYVCNDTFAFNKRDRIINQCKSNCVTVKELARNESVIKETLPQSHFCNPSVADTSQQENSKTSDVSSQTVSTGMIIITTFACD